MYVQLWKLRNRGLIPLARGSWTKYKRHGPENTKVSWKGYNDTVELIKEALEWRMSV